MSEPFLAEIRMVGFNFAPRGWAPCSGQLLPISQNEALFSLLGTTYGGDGRTTFALPDLRGRVPVAPDDTLRLGQQTGAEQVTLQIEDMPAHSHRPLQASAAPADSPIPTGNVPAQTPVTDPLYGGAQQAAGLGTTAVSQAGSSQAHDNMQPFLAVNFCIALRGLFPSRS